MQLKRLKTLTAIVVTFSLLNALSSCSDAPVKKDDSVTIQAPQENQQQAEPAQEPQATEETKTDEPQNPDVETAKEVIDVTLEVGKVFIKNLKTNDSIKMSKREKMYAYQIGLPIRHERDLFEEYKKLYDVESVFILKKSRKDHYIVKYEGKSKEELEAGLENFKNDLPPEIVGGVKIINMGIFCSKREKLMVGEKITKRKEETELPCLICD